MEDQSGTPATLNHILEVLISSLPGNNLYDLAEFHKIRTHYGSKLNKGWVGQTIEMVAGLHKSSKQAKDGIDFELKTSTVISKDNRWIPKETIKVTQLSPQSIIDETFESSALWQKLEKILFVGVYHRDSTYCEAVLIQELDLNRPEYKKIVESFWEDVRHLICEGEYKLLENLGTSDEFIQLRPIGTGKDYNFCPISGEPIPARAFYLTKTILSHLLSKEVPVKA